MPNDFEAFAKTALGTDDPERIAAFKEACKACYDESDGGDDEAAEGDSGDMAGDMAKGKGSMMGKLFG